jgi:hypothetical protein
MRYPTSVIADMPVDVTTPPTPSSNSVSALANKSRVGLPDRV